VNDLQASLERGDFAAVYLIYGNEPGPMRASVEAIREAVVEPGMEAFNHERFIGRELDGIGPVLEACAQLPLMAARRLVELDDPEAIGKGADAAKVQLSALIDYVADPNPRTVLVLSSSGIDGRSRLVTAVKKQGVVVKFEPLRREREAVDFVAECAKAGRIRIDKAAASRLVDAVGLQRSALMAALERAHLHAGGNSISVEDVVAVAGDARQAVIFDLTDAVGLGKRDEALVVLERLFRETPSGELGQANATLAMLIRQLRLVFLAKAAQGNVAAIQERAGVPPFVAQKLAQQSRSFDPTRLRTAYSGLARLDRDFKGGAASVVRAPYLALQRWILDVCGGLVRTARRT